MGYYTMTYEVLPTKGAAFEKRFRTSDDGAVFIYKYRNERPAEIASYETYFKGDPYEAMEYLRRNQSNWDGIGIPAAEEKKTFLDKLWGYLGF